VSSAAAGGDLLEMPAQGRIGAAGIQAVELAFT
jgi:hypothetical protein